MKKILFFTPILLIPIIIFPKIVSASIFDNVVTQGDSTSTVNVETSTGGNGNSTTHIETNVNGNDKVYDSNQDGTVHVENTGDTYTVTESPTSTITTTPSATPSGNPHSNSVKSHVSFWTHVKDFFSKIFHFF